MRPANESFISNIGKIIMLYLMSIPRIRAGNPKSTPAIIRARAYQRKEDMCPLKNEDLKYCNTLKEAFASMHMPHPSVDIKAVKRVCRYGHDGRYGVCYLNGIFYFIDRRTKHFGEWVEKEPTRILEFPIKKNRKNRGQPCKTH